MHPVQDQYDITKIKDSFTMKFEELSNRLKTNNENAVQNQDELLGKVEKFKKIIDELKDYEVKTIFTFYTVISLKISLLKALIFHKNLAKSQRMAYSNHMKSSFLKDKIMIVLDFKQKILIGMSPRQINDEYYNQKQRSCLGMPFKTFYFIKMN